MISTKKTLEAYGVRRERAREQLKQVRENHRQAKREVERLMGLMDGTTDTATPLRNYERAVRQLMAAENAAR